MKSNKLQSFFLGILLALVLIWLFLFLIQVTKIQFSFTVQTSVMDTITALSTLAAVLVALGIAIWGDWLKGVGRQSNMQIIKSIENIQTSRGGRAIGYTRLAFENNGETTAEDVEVYVTMIYDSKKPRKDFIPVPLRWTHDGRSQRNFHPEQFGFLDFCSLENASSPLATPILILAAGSLVPTYEEIKMNTNKLELAIFQRSGGTKRFSIYITWVIGQTLVKITRIEELKRKLSF